MCYVIITLRSITWSLLTLLDTVLMLAVLMSPRWLIGGPQIIGFNRLSLNTSWVSMQRNYDTEHLPFIIRNRYSVKREAISKSSSASEFLLKLSQGQLSEILKLMKEEPESMSYKKLVDLLSELEKDNRTDRIEKSVNFKPIRDGFPQKKSKRNLPAGVRREKMHKKKSLLKDSAITESSVFKPTLGIYTRCTKLRTLDHTSFTDDCGPFIRKFTEENLHFPDYWKVVLVLFSCGSVLMLLTTFTSLISCFVRSIFRKSIFILSGIVQAFAGLFFTLSLILYPMGWDTTRVQRVCGPKAESYMLGDCEAGWALYAGIGGAGLCFMCSLLTIQAEISTSNDKVQNEILEGNTLICLV